MGIATFADGDGDNFNNAASGAIEFHSTRYKDFRNQQSSHIIVLHWNQSNEAKMFLNPNGAQDHVAEADENYQGITAAYFNQSSSKKLKRDIKDFKDCALSIINSLNIKEYKRLRNGKSTEKDCWQVGIMT